MTKLHAPLRFGTSSRQQPARSRRRGFGNFAPMYVVRLEKLGTEEPLDRLNDIKACYMALFEHGVDCDSPNEV